MAAAALGAPSIPFIPGQQLDPESAVIDPQVAVRPRVTASGTIALAATFTVATGLQAQNREDLGSGQDEKYWAACAGARANADAGIEACTRILEREVERI